MGNNPGTIGASTYFIVTVPKRKRVQREHTEDWRTIQQYTIWPEQTAYELLRPKSRSRNRPTHNVNNEAVMHLVVLRENTYSSYPFLMKGM